jgi:hypothetical protein
MGAGIREGQGRKGTEEGWRDKRRWSQGGRGKIEKHRRTLFQPRLQVAMHPENMLRDHSVPLLVDVVRYDEEEIESREKRIGKGDVSMRIFVDVVLHEHDERKRISTLLLEGKERRRPWKGEARRIANRRKQRTCP